MMEQLKTYVTNVHIDNNLNYMERDKQDFTYRLFNKLSLKSVIAIYLTVFGIILLCFIVLLTINLTQPKATYQIASIILCSTGILISLTMPIFLRERFIVETKLTKQNKQL